ncbi:hypothetical protein X797_012442 [Metarhizium robertsii]|uniref:Uncharacterized protein n=1 Tax=Metarhizium robertsii TaxID=568076 RepID=A0A014NZV7_9HYPO|nr:hypothetical protein X797_012442 [Metarhizium robertsii]
MDNTVSGLQKITKLESPDQYIEWNRQITDFLSTHNYGRLFNALKEPPVKLQSDTEREYANVLERWEEKQDNACNCVRATLGYNAREIVKSMTDKPFNRLHEVLETIEEHYKLTGRSATTVKDWGMTKTDAGKIAGIPAESEIGTLFARLSLATTPSSKVQRTLESLSKTDIFDSGTSQHTFTRKENFMSLRPYLGDGVLGVGGKITYPKAIGTYKVPGWRSTQRQS